jgi:hypothetical protein
MTLQSSQSTTRPGALLRLPAIWATIGLILYLLVNIAQSLSAPGAFAVRFGTPLSNPGDVAFVYAYAVRTLFTAALCAGLIAYGQLKVLAGLMVLATLIPLGDGLIVIAGGGPVEIIIRHFVIAVIVLCLGLWLRHTAGRQAQ